jgi:hypothetical protein
MISTENWKVEQPMSKTLARHPLVLLDQQLKNLAKEDDVPPTKTIVPTPTLKE